MSLPPIEDILARVGRLDDAPGEDSGRERFRRYLEEHVNEPGSVRRYIDQCLERTEERYVRALQDLVNHVGRILGFDVAFGKYDWVPGEVAFNGRWESSWGSHVVIEIRKRESYAGWRPTLARSIEGLIAEGEIPSWSFAVGLYIIARPKLKTTILERAILEERQALQLRIISLDSLLTLAELKHDGRLSHQDVLTVLRSSSPSTDWLIELVQRLALQEATEETPPRTAAEPPRSEFVELGRCFEEVGQAVDRFADCICEALDELFSCDPKPDDEITDV